MGADCSFRVEPSCRRLPGSSAFAYTVFLDIISSTKPDAADSTGQQRLVKILDLSRDDREWVVSVTLNYSSRMRPAPADDREPIRPAAGKQRRTGLSHS